MKSQSWKRQLHTVFKSTLNCSIFTLFHFSNFYEERKRYLTKAMIYFLCIHYAYCLLYKTLYNVRKHVYCNKWDNFVLKYTKCMGAKMRSTYSLIIINNEFSVCWKCLIRNTGANIQFSLLNGDKVCPLIYCLS